MKMSLSLLAFHALTGSGTTPYLAGYTRTVLSVFTPHPELLQGLGKDQLTPDTLAQVENLICIVYNVPCLREEQYMQENLLPTSDALKHLVMRAQLQVMIWLKATQPKPSIPQATECGWKLENNLLHPVLITLEPQCCINLISCGCTGTLYDPPLWLSQVKYALYWNMPM